MKETERTLLEIADIVSALDGTVSGPKDFDRRCKWLREQMDAYATAKAKASCEATLRKAGEKAMVHYKGNLMSDPSDSSVLYHPDGSEFSINKQSIIDPSNIVIL